MNGNEAQVPEGKAPIANEPPNIIDLLDSYRKHQDTLPEFRAQNVDLVQIRTRLARVFHVGAADTGCECAKVPVL